MAVVEARSSLREIGAGMVSYGNMSIEQLRTLGKFTEVASRGGYTLIKSNAAKPWPILGVAHIDFVRDYAGAGVTIKGGSIYGLPLDDRLGVWALLSGLPEALGNADKIPYDVLLTECEEIGSSTARDFYEAGGVTGYNWAFMLDRMGSDAVRYNFTHSEWIKALHSEAWDVGAGSYSCIAEFDECNISAVNFGVGYTGQHTPSCSANVRTVLLQTERVAEFVRRYGRVHFVHALQSQQRRWQTPAL